MTELVGDVIGEYVERVRAGGAAWRVDDRVVGRRIEGARGTWRAAAAPTEWARGAAEHTANVNGGEGRRVAR